MKGTRVEANLFVAGTDKREVELGLGVKSARYIEYLTDSEESVKLVPQIKEELAFYTRISKNKKILLPPTKLIHSTRSNFHLKKKMTM